MNFVFQLNWQAVLISHFIFVQCDSQSQSCKYAKDLDFMQAFKVLNAHSLLNPSAVHIPWTT